jgi:serine/threonine protein kinase
MGDLARRHEKLSHLFLAAAELGEGSRREFLNEQCAGDPELHSEVEQMLAQDREPPLLLRTGGMRDGLERRLRQAQGRIGKFQIVRKLGEGGMGVVWLAEQLEPVRRQVALKLARLDLDTRETLARFESERQALAVLNHPNIAQIYDAGVTDSGRPYFVMEYVEGEPITRFCDRQRLSIPERIELVRAVCDGVQHAHRKAIIHRDITPSNVLVADAGDRPVPKIIDFGIAKDLDRRLAERSFHTVHGVLGTPAYMSPEQLAADPASVDTRTDVYALGAVLYEILVGSPPFGSITPSNLVELCRAVCEQQPAKPSQAVRDLPADAAGRVAAARGTDAHRLARRLRGDLDWIVLKALEKDPARRYGSAAELADDLGRQLGGEPVHAGPPGRVYRLRKFARRHWRSVSLLLSVGVLLLASSAGLVVSARRAATDRDRANQERDRANQESAANKQTLDFLMNMIQKTGPDPKVGNLIALDTLVEWGPTDVERHLAGQPLAQARVLDVLSQVYEQWDPRQAILLSKRAIAKLEEASGPDHPDVLARKYAFAETRLYRYELDEAEPVLREVLQAKERLLGPEHPEVLRIVSDLGWLTKRRGRFDEAHGMLRDCLARQRRVLGESHPDTLMTMWRLAGVQMDLGDLAGGRAVLLGALENMRRVLGNFDGSVLAATFNIAASSSLLGEKETALRYLRTALENGFIHGLRLDDGRTLGHHEAILGDPALAPLRDEPLFQAMLGPEGYLYDLDAAQWASEPDEALELLARAVRKGFSSAERLESLPMLEPLRERPEFVRLLAELRGRASGATTDPGDAEAVTTPLQAAGSARR